MSADLAHAERIDALERRMLAEMPLVDQPLEHLWLPGLYVRTVVNPAGSLVTTKIHKTRHPFFVMKGVATVRGPDGICEIVAPYQGVTEPGTRRIIFAGIMAEDGSALAGEDVVWTTVHALTPEEEAEPDEQRRIAMIEERIIERRELDDGQTSHELFLDAFRHQELGA